MCDGFAFAVGLLRFSKLPLHPSCERTKQTADSGPWPETHGLGIRWLVLLRPPGGAPWPVYHRWEQCLWGVKRKATGPR